MKKMILLLLLAVCMLLMGCQDQNVNTSYELEKFFSKLETKTIATSIVQEFSQDYYAVLDKRKKAVENNFQWYKEYTENNTYPYPYDEGLGITEMEYNNLMNGKYISLVEDKNIPFKCEKEDSDVYHIVIKGDNPLEFTMDLNENVVKLSSGKVLEYSKEVKANNEMQHLTGEWEGYTYTFLSTDKDVDSLGEYNIHDDTYNIGYEDIMPELLDKEVEAQLLSISIGKFKDKDQYLIYYREIDVVNQKGNTNYDLYFVK